jgi:hypothetical protein
VDSSTTCRWYRALVGPRSGCETRRRSGSYGGRRSAVGGGGNITEHRESGVTAQAARNTQETAKTGRNTNHGRTVRHPGFVAGERVSE